MTHLLHRFRAIKTFGISKGAVGVTLCIARIRIADACMIQPKVTITLLDQEDLRALAHLMNSYPAILKEKALSVLGNSGTK